MAVEISSALLLRLMRETAWGERHEICGLLRGRGDRVLRADRARNVSPSPADSFEIDPQRLIAALRRARRTRALAVLGYYHSHPNGDPEPSPRDADCAAPDGKLWLIVTTHAARLWRAVERGELHGRFDPVRLDLREGQRLHREQPGVIMRGPSDPAAVMWRAPLIWAAQS